MPYFSVKTLSNSSAYILSISDKANCHIINSPLSSHFNNSRSLSSIGSESYKRSLSRAFTRAKQIAFFNPDMNHFITLTYKGSDHSPTKVINDVKNLIKKQSYHDKKQGKISRPFKYIYVMEYQKRGSIHVHMVCNEFLDYEMNKNSYRSVKYWNQGFSSVLTISDFDSNFRPYLYLFKYMTKAQRVGKSFIHTSRNFDSIVTVDYMEVEDAIKRKEVKFTEDIKFRVGGVEYGISKKYIK